MRHLARTVTGPFALALALVFAGAASAQQLRQQDLVWPTGPQCTAPDGKCGCDPAVED